MSEPITQAELSRHLRLLEQAVAERVAAERAIEDEFAVPVDPQQEALAAVLVQRENEYEQLLATLSVTHEERRREIGERFDAEQQAADSERRESRNAVEKQANDQIGDVTRKHDDARWVAQSVLDETSEESPKRQFDRIRNQLEKSGEQQQVAYDTLKTDVQAAMDDRNWSREPPPPPESAPKKLDDLAAEFTASVDAARDALATLKKLRVPKLFIGMRPLWLFVLLLLATGVPAYFFVEPSMVGATVSQDEGAWIGMVGGAAFVASLLLLTVLYTLSSMQLSDVFSQMQEETASAAFYHEQRTRAADAERRRKQKEFDAQQQKMEQQLAGQLGRFEAVHQQTLDEVAERRQAELNNIDREYIARTQDIADRRSTALSQADDEHRQQVDETTIQFNKESVRLQSAHDDYVFNRQQSHRLAVNSMTNAWNNSLHSVAVAQAAAVETSRALFRRWDLLAGDDWVPPTAIPHGLRLGQYDVDLSMLEGGIPTQEPLVPQKTDLPFPMVLPFPSGASLLMKTDGPESRRAALQAMQVYVLRMLTLLPPGKVRLTIFDPIGLGESFSGLMHLADYDELLITSRIWTESAHIEARLADLTEHMENVLQKYLRNEFSSIEAYNDFAGEVAEPYHVLVVADFPNKFSEQAARRLTSIATSGPRCGVSLLMSADRSQPTPHGFDLADIEAAATTLSWHTPFPRSQASAWERTTGEASASPDTLTADDIESDGDESRSGSFTSTHSQANLGNEDEAAFYLDSDDAALSRWPIVLDEPPPPDVHTRIVKQVGEASKDVRRVEVSFGRIAPSPDDVWSKDSRREIDIPLGRAGALKLQHLRLGKGTSQHMLVAGKTGSGKSTFFHALITNAALHYSPEELEFYLVDFKKGVEFKAYAGGKLPHARVIAIESDREFGISVLQRLDGILHERGELFRELGVQDVGAYRDRVAGSGMPNSGNGSRSSHPQSMPRILLVIDEFQEFFVEDDRDSQRAALLLDRLVRQGRAFGIHVILGSQTLGGAYSLARSTLGQVAVRVALQCSEADAHLILSESNTAARLLIRPGEAIYNDSNGSVEGNHPFQIAWLPDEEREGYLGVLQHFVKQRGLECEPAIVFEGNIASDPARNSELTRLIESGTGTAIETAAPQTGSLPQSTDNEQQTTDISRPAIWLGEAVEIGPPTSVTFPQQAGSNLLLIGQDPNAATGILATSYLALAAQLRSADDESADQQPGPRLWILDGSHVGSPEAEFWKQLAGVSPAMTRIVTPGNVKLALDDLTAERERREQAGVSETLIPAPLFVLVGSLSKFRDLRKGEDDFGFGGFGSDQAQKPADPAGQFADLIAKGPEQGMHVLAWVDSANNLDRWLSRQSLKEFELRITFAMNANDSSQLIDSPAAAKLGPHRALLHREETGTTTKFRPYGPPSGEWLNRVRLHLSAAQPLESAMDLDGFQVS